LKLLNAASHILALATALLRQYTDEQDWDLDINASMDHEAGPITLLSCE
jgi:hypothetical protein